MNSKITNPISGLLKGVALAGAAVVLVASTAVFAGPAHRGLTGTWFVTVQQYDCKAGANLGMPFESFLTFGPVGTLVETTDNPTFAPGQRGPGHGFWERTHRNSFRAVSEAFILFTTPAHGQVPEFDVGRQRIDQSIDYDGGNQFTSDAAVTFTDPSGTVLRSGCAHATATRMDD
ncbi:MAG TPA: hypothetical protein VLX90_03660 [Steroidobacteraceae bacterium]|nr:hypothetical protein [Steroidobacteraceae bacterium]